MAEEKKKRKRKSVTAEVKAAEVSAEVEISGPPLEVLPQTRHEITVEVDESEYQLIRMYAKQFNEEHESIEGFIKVDEGQYMLLATLRWFDYNERAAAEGMESGSEEDVTPIEPPVPALATSLPDSVDDDPEFVEAWAARIGGHS